MAAYPAPVAYGYGPLVTQQPLPALGSPSPGPSHVGPSPATASTTIKSPTPVKKQRARKQKVADTAASTPSKATSPSVAGKKKKSHGKDIPDYEVVLQPGQRVKADDEKGKLQRQAERTQRNRASAHKSRLKKEAEYIATKHDNALLRAHIARLEAIITSSGTEFPAMPEPTAPIYDEGELSSPTPAGGSLGQVTAGPVPVAGAAVPITASTASVPLVGSPYDSMPDLQGSGATMATDTFDVNTPGDSPAATHFQSSNEHDFRLIASGNMPDYATYIDPGKPTGVPLGFPDLEQMPLFGQSSNLSDTTSVSSPVPNWGYQQLAPDGSSLMHPSAVWVQLPQCTEKSHSSRPTTPPRSSCPPPTSPNSTRLLLRWVTARATMNLPSSMIPSSSSTCENVETSFLCTLLVNSLCLSRPRTLARLGIDLFRATCGSDCLIDLTRNEGISSSFSDSSAGIGGFRFTQKGNGTQIATNEVLEKSQNGYAILRDQIGRIYSVENNGNLCSGTPKNLLSSCA